jgi:hypothetical protein
VSDCYCEPTVPKGLHDAMWTILALIIGAILATTAAFGLVQQQQSSMPKDQIQAPLVDYGTR